MEDGCVHAGAGVQACTGRAAVPYNGGAASPTTPPHCRPLFQSATLHDPFSSCSAPIIARPCPKLLQFTPSQPALAQQTAMPPIPATFTPSPFFHIQLLFASHNLRRRLSRGAVSQTCSATVC
eukprot:362474-Chlamydomonas_euryale.AAC.3